MLLEYIAIAVMIAVATLIAAIAIGLGELLGPKKKIESERRAIRIGHPPHRARDAAHAGTFLSRCGAFHPV